MYCKLEIYWNIYSKPQINTCLSESGQNNTKWNEWSKCRSMMEKQAGHVVKILSSINLDNCHKWRVVIRIFKHAYRLISSQSIMYIVWNNVVNFVANECINTLFTEGNQSHEKK